MKVKSLFLMALAASMAFVSCDKSENDLGEATNSQPKRVTIKLPNLKSPSGTRAVGDAMEENSQVALSNFEIFFLDAAGNVVNIPEYPAGTQQQTYFANTDQNWAEIAATGKDLTYHFLPPATVKVVVVGNQGENFEYSTIASKTEDVPNDENGIHPTYTLYGSDDLEEGGAPDDETHENVYQAEVTLEPRVSRFEIYGFEYEQATAPATNKYTSVKLEKIALNHYYTQYDFVTKAPSETGKVFDNPTSETVWTWVDGRTGAWADVLSSTTTALSLTPGESKAPNGGDVVENGTNAEDIITYGLAHVADKTNNPQLLLTLHGTTAAGTEEPIYLIGTFTGTNNSAFESGKIYRVFYSFSDEDFDQPERCVELNVKVATWTVVPVTPEF